jgi:hypothetical protein
MQKKIISLYFITSASELLDPEVPSTMHKGIHIIINASKRCGCVKYIESDGGTNHASEGTTQKNRE